MTLSSLKCCASRYAPWVPMPPCKPMPELLALTNLPVQNFRKMSRWTRW